MGIISGVHGIKGLVKVKSYTETPEDIFSYKFLWDESFTKSFALTLKSSAKDCFIASVEGLTNRNMAEEVKGTKLYVKKEDLPNLEEDTFWHNDLIGLSVKDDSDKIYGKIIAVHNFGAGDVLEVKTADGASVMLPFTKEQVPVIDIDKGWIIIANDDWFKTKGKDKGKDEENV